MGMGKVGVTGGAGFVGTNLVRALLNDNHDVLVVDDFSTGLESNLSGLECQILNISLSDSFRLRGALHECEYIFHLGARGSVPRSLRNPRATMDVNVLGTLNILEIARATGASVAFSSSSSIYGSNRELPKSEKMWAAPITPYAASKLSAEALVSSYAESYNVSAVTYRFFNVFGPWQRPDHDYAAVIPKWIWKLMQRQSIQVFGDGEQSRDFTYIDTVVSVLVQGMDREINHPLPINLAFGEAITLNQCIAELKKKFADIRVEYLPERQGDVKNSSNNPALLNELFPDIKKIDFVTALDKTLEWFMKYGKKIANGPKVSV